MVLASLRSATVSPALVLISLVSFTLGLVGGGVAYGRSSGVAAVEAPGTHAWSIHVVLLIATVATAVAVRLRRGNWSWLSAPVGWAAARRCSATLRSTFRGPATAARTAGALILFAVIQESYARLGYQVLGALDANETVNAWGGPTYLGALLCHGLDLALIVAACSTLLAKLLAPAPTEAPTDRLAIVSPHARPHHDSSSEAPQPRSGGPGPGPDRRHHHQGNAADRGTP